MLYSMVGLAIQVFVHSPGSVFGEAVHVRARASRRCRFRHGNAHAWMRGLDLVKEHRGVCLFCRWVQISIDFSSVPSRIANQLFLWALIQLRSSAKKSPHAAQTVIEWKRSNLQYYDFNRTHMLEQLSRIWTPCLGGRCVLVRALIVCRVSLPHRLLQPDPGGLFLIMWWHSSRSVPLLVNDIRQGII